MEILKKQSLEKTDKPVNFKKKAKVIDQKYDRSKDNYDSEQSIEPPPELKGIMDVLDEDQLQHELVTADKFSIFMDWLLKEGFYMPKLQYPAYFDDGLCGTKVIEDIQHREAFAFCPFKMILSTKKAQTHPIVGDIIQENDSVFMEDGRNEDWEQ